MNWQFIFKFLKWIANHTFGHVVTLPIVALVLIALNYILDYFSSSSETPLVIDYLLLHPERTVLTFLIIGIVLNLFKRGYAALKTSIRNKEILANVGVSGFWNHADDNEKQTNWNSCEQKIIGNTTNELRILVATGWETFGKAEAPLHNLVETFRGEIRILLLKPGCKAANVRAKSVGVSPEDYDKEINDTIFFCTKLRDSGKTITVKFYEQAPIWKMIFTENYMWLQYYKLGAHVNNTPVYTLFANQNETSLYFPLINVFRKKWEYDKNETAIKPDQN